MNEAKQYKNYKIPVRSIKRKEEEILWPKELIEYHFLLKMITNTKPIYFFT